MATWNFLAAYGLTLTYIVLGSASAVLAAAGPIWTTRNAASELFAGLEPGVPAQPSDHNEGFFAGLADGELVLFGPSMGDRQAILPYVGILCGGDSL